MGGRTNTGSLRLLWAGVLMAALGNGLTLPYLMVYLHLVVGLPTAVAGAVIAYEAALGLLATPLIGWAVDHFGPGRMLTLGLVIDAAGVALLTQVRSPESAFAVATVMAIGNFLMWPPQSSLLARLAPEGERQRVFAFQFLLLNLGLGLGGLMASTIADVHHPRTFTYLYLINMATYLVYAGISVALWRKGRPVPKPVEDTEGPGGYREVLADRVLWRLVPAVLFVLVCGYGQLEVGFTSYATTVLHVSPRLMGVAWAANTFTIVVAQLFVLKLMAGRSRTRTLQAAASIWASVWVLAGVALHVHSVVVVAGMLMLALAVFGFGETLWSPTLPALLNDLAPDHLRGRYNSIQSAGWTIAATVGPLVSGLLIGGGLATWWVWSMLVGCVLGAVALGPLRRVLTVAQDGRGSRHESPSVAAGSRSVTG